jgi:hypothetical protein
MRAPRSWEIQYTGRVVALGRTFSRASRIEKPIWRLLAEAGRVLMP